MQKNIQKPRIVFDTHILAGAAEAWADGGFCKHSRVEKLQAVRDAHGRVEMLFNQPTLDLLVSSLAARARSVVNPQHRSACYSQFLAELVEPNMVMTSSPAPSCAKLAIAENVDNFVCVPSDFDDVTKLFVPITAKGFSLQLMSAASHGASVATSLNRIAPAPDQLPLPVFPRPPVVLDTCVLMDALHQLCGRAQRSAIKGAPVNAVDLVERMMTTHTPAFTSKSWAEFKRVSGNFQHYDLKNSPDAAVAAGFCDRLAASRHLVQPRRFPLYCEQDKSDQEILRAVAGSGARLLLTADNHLLRMRFDMQAQGVTCLHPRDMAMQLETESYRRAVGQGAKSASKQTLAPGR